MKFQSFTNNNYGVYALISKMDYQVGDLAQSGARQAYKLFIASLIPRLVI